MHPFLILALLGTTAAGPPPPPAAPLLLPAAPGAPAARAPDQDWYGAPAVASDAGVAAIMLLSAGLESRSVFYVGLAAYALGPPLNHLDSGHGPRAVVSFALRAAGLGAAAALLAVGMHANGCGSDGSNANCDLILLSPIPVIASMVIDDGWLAHHRGTSARRDTVAFSPTVSLARGGGTLGLSTVF